MEDTGFGPIDLYLARMFTLLGNSTEARDHFERARKRLDANGSTHLRAIVDYDQACSLMRAGMTDKTHIIKLLDAAISGFRSHGMPGWAKSATERKEALITDAYPDTNTGLHK